jgi:AraC family transcriptional regulator of adaptative response/methylated-DNA-[protein]-cysteine methyltransferase
METKESTEDYSRIAQAIAFIEAHYRSQPSLDTIAAHVGLSKYHFIRLFKRWAGITPIQFLHFLTIEYSKKMLENSSNLLDTAYDAGLSGPGRLHDLFVTFEAMTPGEYKRLGEGLQICYGFSPCPFGLCLLGLTERGICYLGFAEAGEEKSALHDLQRRWPNSSLKEDNARIARIVQTIFDRKESDGAPSKPFHLLLKGTNFQVNVWKGLLNIPPGSRICYEDLANLLGRPGAHRAVASAVASNPLGYLIPCHRVIAKSGKISDYHWGRIRKRALLGWEAGIAG